MTLAGTVNLFVGGDTTWTVENGSTLIDDITNASNGAFNFNGHKLTLAGTGNVIFGGNGLDHGGGTLADNLTGTLTLAASATSSFISTSAVKFNSGTLLLAASGGLGTSSLVMNGGTFLDNTQRRGDESCRLHHDQQQLSRSSAPTR